MRLIQDRFYPGAGALRRQFESRFADPRAGDSARFVWDYWHVPDQYTLLRTPAQAFFERRSFSRFQQALLQFGRQRLGCTGITPPWLSYYVDGCRQEWHADVPHGPWAFVFSLTPWGKRRFSGGETLLLKPGTLRYWERFGGLRGVERDDLIERIPAEFNRLLVFDPRVPHSVSEVRGTHDPREARLVIHGWFTDPQPTVEGGLARSGAARGISGLLESLDPWFSRGGRWHGVLSLRVDVAASGKVSRARILASTLRDLDGPEEATHALERAVLSEARRARFPRARRSSVVTLPLVFRWKD